MPASLTSSGKKKKTSTDGLVGDKSSSVILVAGVMLWCWHRASPWNRCQRCHRVPSLPKTQYYQRRRRRRKDGADQIEGNRAVSSGDDEKWQRSNFVAEKRWDKARLAKPTNNSPWPSETRFVNSDLFWMKVWKEKVCGSELGYRAFKLFWPPNCLS